MQQCEARIQCDSRKLLKNVLNILHTLLSKLTTNNRSFIHRVVPVCQTKQRPTSQNLLHQGNEFRRIIAQQIVIRLLDST